MNARRGAALLFIVVLGFYIYTLLPSLGWGDSARLQQEALRGESLVVQAILQEAPSRDPFPFPHMGIAAWDHPLWIVLAHSLAHSLPWLEPLWLVNLVSALFAAAAVAVVYLICLEHTHSATASLLASLSLAVGRTFWFHAVVAEVYSLFAFLLLTSLYLYDSYRRSGWGPALAGSLLALGLGMSNHLLTGLALPALLLYAVLARARRPTTGPPARHLVAGGLAFLLGFSLYLFQAARLLRYLPPLRLAKQVLGVTFFGQVISTTTPAALARSVGFSLVEIASQFGPLALAGVLGFIAGRRAYPALWAKSLAFWAVFAFFGVFYRVGDQFSFLLPSYLFWALAMGMGIAWLLDRRPLPQRRPVIATLAVLVLVMPFYYHILPGLLRLAGATDATFGIPQVGSTTRDGLTYYVNPDKRGNRDAYRFGQQTMQSLAPRAVVIASAAYDPDVFFTLRYFSAVEGARPDIEINGWLLSNPYTLDPAEVAAKIEAAIHDRRPVYLASLNEEFYAARALAARYDFVPEANLYRLLPISKQGRH